MKNLCLSGVLAVCALSATAQTTSTPTFDRYKFEDGAVIANMSNNGQWAVTYTSDPDKGTYKGARIVNLQTGKDKVLVASLNTDTVASNSVYDVTNDGNIAVGELNSKPAYYSAKEDKWVFLPLAGDADCGLITSVTPDGKYAVGRINYSDPSREYEEAVAFWDLTTNKLLPTPGIPTKDMSHQDQKMNRFMNISADGKYILGCMSFTYLPMGEDLGGCFCYVYDVEKKTYKPIGFDETETGRWKAHHDGLFYIGEATMSNNGEWVTGGAYLVKAVSGSEFPSEYEVPYRYNVKTGEIQVYDDNESIDKYGWSIDNQGNVYAAGPAASPYRDFSVRSGKYWIDFTQTMKQKYQKDIMGELGISNSGTPISLSDDGLTIATTIDPHEAYIVRLTEPFTQIADNINLLSDYTVTPAKGSSISRLTNITIGFTRDVKVVGDASDIILQDPFTKEELATAVSFKADGKNVNIVFRGAALPEKEEGMPYYVIIPAKTICLANDATRFNEQIRLNYSARAEKPVEMVSASPEENKTIGKLDASTNPIVLTFDADLKLKDENVRGKIYQGDNAVPFADLMLLSSGSKVMVYPATTQYLYKDVNYRIEIPAGTFTDVTGNEKTANEVINLHYKGAYEREISYDENVLFETNFDQGVTGMLVLDNDENKPSPEAQQMGFTDARYGWIPVWDENETDHAVGSTSMYTPAGKSDDWLVTPQIKVVDKLCKLTFQSQSFSANKKDNLKVYVWASNEMYNMLDKATVEKIRTEGKLVYNELQSPGKNENVLKGDWKDNAVSLAEFAGKNVYIAFLNDNEDQSMVFIDNVRVLHELPYYVGVTNDETVVDANEIIIKGVADIRDAEKVFTTAKLTLKDAKGKVIDEIKEEGLSLKMGDKYNFEFAKALPLAVGEVNNFSIDLLFNDVANTLESKIKSLAFQPKKRIVLEELTGTDCPNCPQGILAIDKLHATYGELFIPMALHCYDGDPFMTGVTPYAQFLKLTAAPSGIIQRSGTINFPMTSVKAGDGFDYTFNAPEGTAPLWMDLVAEELNKPTEAEITATATLDASATNITVPVNVRYALNATDLYHKVFAVILENDLVSYQRNNLASLTDPDLGEWGKGGLYGQSTVQPYTFDHVVRGYLGTTFTGTPELIPAEVKAGETYSTTLNFPVPAHIQKAWNTDIVVMLFDGNTDKLINAYQTKVTVPDAIENAQTTGTATIEVTAAANKVWVNTTDAATVTVLAADGRTLTTAQGQGTLSIDVNNYRGMALVRVTTAQGTVVKKVLL